MVVRVLLSENCSPGIDGGVCLDTSLKSRVENKQDQGWGYSSFEGVKCGLGRRWPMEIVFFGEFCEGLGNVGEVVDELAVVIYQFEKHLNIFE